MIRNSKLNIMKPNPTLVVVIRIVAFILLCLYSLLVFGQDQSFQTKASFTVATPVAESALVSFQGNDAQDKVRLQWTLADGNKATSVLVEKSYTGDNYQYVADFWVNLDGNSITNFKYSDAKKGNKTVYYRLKITDDNGLVQYSKVIYFSEHKGK
jgi:hypothetical protein